MSSINNNNSCAAASCNTGLDTEDTNQKDYKHDYQDKSDISDVDGGRDVDYVNTITASRFVANRYGVGVVRASKGPSSSVGVPPSGYHTGIRSSLTTSGVFGRPHFNISFHHEV